MNSAMPLPGPILLVVVLAMAGHVSLAAQNPFPSRFVCNTTMTDNSTLVLHAPVWNQAVVPGMDWLHAEVGYFEAWNHCTQRGLKLPILLDIGDEMCLQEYTKRLLAYYDQMLLLDIPMRLESAHHTCDGSQTKAFATRSLMFTSIGSRVPARFVCAERAMRCNKLPVPVGGKIVYTDGTKSGSTAHIQCTDKYRLVGSPTLTCLDDGEWSDSEPHCEEIRCPSLSMLPNGVVHLENQRFPGSRAFLRCNVGFEPDGPSTLLCRISLSWNASLANCTPIVVDLSRSCPDLSAPRNGGITLEQEGHAVSIAKYTCSSGFHLVGETILMCQKNQTWSGKPPRCQHTGSTTVPTASPVPASSAASADRTYIYIAATLASMLTGAIVCLVWIFVWKRYRVVASAMQSRRPSEEPMVFFHQSRRGGERPSHSYSGVRTVSTSSSSAVARQTSSSASGSNSPFEDARHQTSRVSNNAGVLQSPAAMAPPRSNVCTLGGHRLPEPSDPTPVYALPQPCGPTVVYDAAEDCELPQNPYNHLNERYTRKAAAAGEGIYIYHTPKPIHKNNKQQPTNYSDSSDSDCCYDKPERPAPGHKPPPPPPPPPPSSTR